MARRRGQELALTLRSHAKHGVSKDEGGHSGRGRVSLYPSLRGRQLLLRGLLRMRTVCVANPQEGAPFNVRMIRRDCMVVKQAGIKPE